MQRELLIVALAACGRVNFDALADNGDARGFDAPVVSDGATDGRVFVNNVAFVTSTLTRPGDLGGVAGADAIWCDRAAAAGLGSNYLAYLSSTSTSTLAPNATARLYCLQD